MKKQKIFRHVDVAFTVLAILLGCLAIAFILAVIFVRITASIMGYDVSHEPTLSFRVLVLLIWIFLLFLVKWYPGALLPLGCGFMKKEKIFRGLAVTITVVTILIGCLVIAVILAVIIYKMIGFNVPEEPSPHRLKGLILLIWILLSFVVRWYLAHRNIAKYIDLFGEIIRVLENIAKGDFNVRLDDKFNENESFGKLVKSVNNMASDLDRMEKMRQEFISNVSHEIQSPLACQSLCPSIVVHTPGSGSLTAYPAGMI